MSYSIHPKIIARLPSFYFIEQISFEKMMNLLEDGFFCEAIYLASPILYKEAIKLKKGEITNEKEVKKITYSLTKYAQRMFSRCTPFGLFAGCSTISWSENTKWNVDRTIKRNSRLDMHYLCALADDLSKKEFIKPYIKFYTNNSTYSIADEIRYIDYHYKNGKRKHSISAVDKNDFTQAILEKAIQGATIETLIAFLVEMDCDVEEANEFIQSLIENQLLVSELEPAITGDGFLKQIINSLQNISSGNEQLETTITTLKQLDNTLMKFDENEYNYNLAYLNLQEIIKTTGIAFEENKLVQTDIFYDLNATIDNKYKDQIMETLTFFQKHFSMVGNYNLQNFIKKFNERYEDVEMPLLEVLDSVSGIGYTDQPPKTITPLLEDIIIQTERKNYNDIRITDTQQVLLKKLIKATSTKDYTIELFDEDFTIQKKMEYKFSPSLSCMCKIVENETLLIDHFSGSSAANLLGRFCFGDDAIYEIVKDVTKQEQNINKDIIFAEIIHLPESRVGNILQHPPCREYEISYLGKSSLPATQQITLQDIMVSVRNGAVTLRSKRLGKVIIPRLSNAHNYSFNALPVYQFLCELQHQHFASGLSFQWGDFSSFFTFLPRVIYKGTIISLATWLFDSELLKKIQSLDFDSFKDFAKNYNFPHLIVLVDGDNELLIDLNSELSVNVFLDTIKKRNAIQIKEYWSKNVNNNSPIHELIVSLINQKTVYENLSNINELPLKNYSIPGSKWVYFKIYCGINDADFILRNSISNLVKELETKYYIQNWFFIRYNDPNFHIRLRLKLHDTNDLGNVIRLCNSFFEKLMKDSLVWNVIMDTYNKEQNRYKLDNMYFHHLVFNADSITTLQFLQNCDNEEQRWLFAWQKTNVLLDSFKLNLQEKEKMLFRLKESYGVENNFNKHHIYEINRKFKIAKVKIDLFENVHINHFFENLKPIAERIILALNSNNEKLYDVIASYIHMMLNRIFITNSRQQEAVLYELLFQHYKALRYKQKNYVEQ